MRIKYQDFRLSSKTISTIDTANRILVEYANRGIIVTLRQLYYQFVSRDLIQNKQSEYKRLGSIINDGRLAGLIDWDYLQDRTRNLNENPHWDSPSGVIESAARSYQRNLWNGQSNYVEVWVEKDALLSVIEGVCQRYDVPYFACRGYTSQSEMWSASQRIVRKLKANKNVFIIHLGDHDPSGVDMSRDIQDRLVMFARKHTHANLAVNRIALNMDQIERYNPPPNPAKMTDSRAIGYVDIHGSESWELDALDPDVLIELIESTIKSYMDEGLYNQQVSRQEEEREILNKTSRIWDAASDFVAEYEELA